MDDTRARGITAGIGIDHRILGVDARIDWLKGAGEPRRAALLGAHTSSYATGVVYAVGTILGMIGLVVAREED